MTLLRRACAAQWTAVKIVFWTLPRYYFYSGKILVLKALLYVIEHIGERL